jgi:hypothetical protein
MDMPTEEELAAELDEPAPEPVVTWQCMQPAYQATLAGAAAPPVTLTPADLAGSVEREYTLEIEDVLPERCAALIDQASTELFVSFDPEWHTVYPSRPGGQDESHPELDGQPEGAPVEDPTAVTHARAFAGREVSAATQTIAAIQADPGVDFELRHLTTSSSVVLLHEDVAQPWDFEVSAMFSVDGHLDEAHAAQLANAREDFAFTLEPAGEPREGCVLPEPLPGFDAEPLAVDDAEGHDSDHESVDLHGSRTIKEHGFALHVAGDTRAKVLTGDWSCFDRFTVRGCLETDLEQAQVEGLGTENDCAALDVRFERVYPEPDNPDRLPENVPQGLPVDAEEQFREKAAGAGGCDEALLTDYTTEMKRYFELERSVRISNWYVMNYRRFVERLGVGDDWNYAPYNIRTGYFSGHIARSPWVGGHIVNCVEHFAATNNLDSNECWGITAIDNNWNNYIRLRRYFLPDNGRGGFTVFRDDPLGVTRGWFEHGCGGIHSGSMTRHWGANTVSTLRTWADRWVNPDPIHAQFDVVGRPWAGPNITGVGCARYGLYMLQRYQVGPNGEIIEIPDDGAFYTEYLPRILEKTAAKARADAIWNRLVNSCTSFSAPAWSSEAISQTRLAPALYPTKSVAFGGVTFGAEGGIVNDALVNKITGEFVLTAGPKVRTWLTGTIASEVGGIDVSLNDIFGAWLLGRFYSDVVSSHITAGFHVLTADLWKLKYRLPDQFLVPMPPPIEKDRERCRTFFYYPVPVGVELCAGIGGAMGIKGDGPNDEATITVEKVGTTAGADGNPGLVGRLVPYIALKTSGSIGVDFLAGVAGFKLNLDPTIELQFPIEPSLHWSLQWLAPANGLFWTLIPGIRVGFDIVGFGGDLVFQLKMRFGSDSGWTIVDWDPVDLAKETLFERSYPFSGLTNF